MAFFTPGSGNSLFFFLDSLFSQSLIQTLVFLIWHFLICLYVYVFLCSYFVDVWFLIDIFDLFNFDFITSFYFVFLYLLYFWYKQLIAKFLSFLSRTGPRECHHRILREKLYRVHQFSSKLAPRELVLWTRPILRFLWIS